MPEVLAATAHESVPAFVLVLKLIFPVILLLRIVEDHLPLVPIIGGWLAPLMGIVGLPGEAAIPWVAAILTQPFPAFVLLADNWQDLQLTTAQATILGVLVLEAHSIFIEARIAHFLGVRVWVTCVSRFGAAFALGFLLDQAYRQAGWLQDPASLLFITDVGSLDNSWGQWWLSQAKSWLVFAAFLYCLNLFMRFIRAFHVESFFVWLLSPVMRLIGIHRSAATVGVVGLVLGLTFGATLLLAEAKAGRIPRRDLFLSVILLGICHSLLDDTALALLFGAHVSGVLFCRFGFAVIVLAAFSRLLRLVPNSVAERWLMTPGTQPA